MLKVLLDSADSKTAVIDRPLHHLSTSPRICCSTRCVAQPLSLATYTHPSDVIAAGSYRNKQLLIHGFTRALIDETACSNYC